MKKRTVNSLSAKKKGIEEYRKTRTQRFIFIEMEQLKVLALEYVLSRSRKEKLL